MTNVRQVTVWIDAETLLVRKVFEDTLKGYPVGSYSRHTVTIEPEANPPLEDSRFEFTVPTAQRSVPDRAVMRARCEGQT